MNAYIGQHAVHNIATWTGNSNRARERLLQGKQKGNGNGTETNTRTWQGNLIQSKTKLDTDRRWLCVLRSPTAIADATMQQRSKPVTVVARHKEQPHSPHVAASVI